MFITLIRHLPTDWNKKNKLQGRKNIEISELDEDTINSIKFNQELLQKLGPFDLVLASTLKRTHQTAQLYGYIPETETLLDELDFGSFEGISKQRLVDTYGNQWFEDPKSIILGESIGELENRIIAFLDKYKRYSNILAFGHGSWIRAMLSYYRYGHINDMNKMTVRNNACFTVRFDI